MAKKKTEKKESDLQAEIDKSIKMFDVSKPGQSPASATSRPIIVKHGEMMKKDPMVREEETEKEPQKLKTKEHAEKVLSPIADQEEKTEPEVPEVSEKPEEPDEPEQPVAEEAAEVKLETEELPVNQKESPKKSEKKQDEDQAAQVKQAEQSIQAKEFFVPLGKVSRRRSKNIVLILLLFLIVGTGIFINFATDAGIIDIGFQPLTDLL